MPLPPEESRITLAQAARRYPGHRGADRLHPATLARWIVRGVRALNGERVRLEAERIGCAWFTSEGALSRFAEALAAGAGDVSAIRSPAQRRRDSERADAECAAAGY